MTTRSYKKRALGQILPGFWIGRMAAVRAIFEMQQQDDNKEQKEEWTVVSIMSSDTMISTITNTLKEEQQKYSQTHGGCKLVRKHAVWDLPDKSDANFVSSRLNEICQIITHSMEMTTTTTTTKSRPQKNCLVHCCRGVSRSAAVCAAWLISTKGISLSDSMKMIQAVRDVNPNLGFIAGLRAIEKCLGDIVKAEQRLSRKQQQQKKKKLELAAAAVTEKTVEPDAAAQKEKEKEKAVGEQDKNVSSSEAQKAKEEKKKATTKTRWHFW